MEFTNLSQNSKQEKTLIRLLLLCLFMPFVKKLVFETLEFVYKGHCKRINMSFYLFQIWIYALAIKYGFQHVIVMVRPVQEPVKP